MTATQQLWLASLAGALVFFVAGALVMAIRSRGRASPAVAGPSLAELDQLRQRAERADAATGAAQVQAQAKLDGIHRKLADAEAARTTAEAARTAAEAARGTLQSELADETARLRRAVDDAEAMRADFLRLRTQTHETEFLTKEVHRLSTELTSAKSLALGGTRRVPRPVRPSKAAATGSITEALAGVIERFSDAQMRSIAIADNVGFPVSSHGDDGVELAAYAALLNDVASRAHQFLPVATPASIEMLDVHGARISVWPFNLGDDRLLLVNLAVGATDPARVECALADVVAILEPSAAPRGKTA